MTKISYAISVGSDRIAEQAEYLIRSITTTSPNSDIYGYVTKQEYSKLNDTRREFLQNHIELLVGENPIPEYPIAIKISALLAALHNSQTDYVALLDTDSLLLNQINPPKIGDAELLAKPVDVANQYWASEDSTSDWRLLYDRFNKDFPNYRLKSTVDQQSILPYWNAGLVITNTKKLAEEWLDLTIELYQELEKQFYTDQVALSLASTGYKTANLSEKYNFPLPHRLWCPSEARLIHYHKYRYLARVLNPIVRHEIKRSRITNAQGFPKRRKVMKEATIQVYNMLSAIFN